MLRLVQRYLLRVPLEHYLCIYLIEWDCNLADHQTAQSAQPIQ